MGDYPNVLIKRLDYLIIKTKTVYRQKGEKTMAYKYSYNDEEVKYQEPKLKTDRNILTYTLLSILTLGIYSIIFYIPFSLDLEKVNPSGTRGKLMNYLSAYLLSLFTFAIVVQIWHYQVAERIEEALDRRRIDYEFGTSDFWKWNILGSLILVGPIIYNYKLFKAMNLLCESYNEEKDQ